MGTAFEAMSDAVLAIASERSLEPILERMVQTARELAGGRYAALGTPDGRGGFRRFITSGLSDEEIARIGPLPRTHGLLGAMLESPEPTRHPRIKEHPRFQWWPAAHPEMTSFLGVPIVSKGEVIGAFYVTDKRDAPEFTDADQEQIELLAAHAAVAIENARAFELSRELSMVEERARLARELHDSVSQRLFSLSLAAASAAELLKKDQPAKAREQLERVEDLAHGAIGELRSVIHELRPPQLDAEGLDVALRKHVELAARVHEQRIEFAVHGIGGALTPTREAEAFRVAQEALANALRHARAERIGVTLERRDGGLRLVVEDDGRGFDPAAKRATRLGLTSMEERAAALGGALTIASRPGSGTTVTLELDP